MSFAYGRAAVSLAIFAMLAVPASSAAQQAVASASVTGTVFDPTAAVITGAAVSLRNHETNQVIETRSDQSGRYRFVYVPVGDYHLSVVAPGFAVTNVNLTLSVGQAIDVPVTLSPRPRKP
jgi:hypothetical protein